MKIGSILENQNHEKRIAITPELVKKYTSLGFEVNLIENYGSHLGIKDEQFRDMGVKISKDESEILNVSDIVKVAFCNDVSSLKEEATAPWTEVLLLINFASSVAAFPAVVMFVANAVVPANMFSPFILIAPVASEAPAAL